MRGSMRRESGRSRPRRVGVSWPVRWRLPDELWEKVAAVLVDPPRRFRYPGRGRYSPRLCLEGILFVLFYDVPWAQLPYRELGLPSGQTLHRRLQEWVERGVFQQVIELLQAEL